MRPSTARRISRGSGRLVRAVARRLPRSVARVIPRRPMVLDRNRSALRARELRSIQLATFYYEYAGHRCVKNPFDLALYMMLLSRERPRTIVEIGSYQGGSAVFFAAQARALDLGAHVYSVDIEKVVDVHDPDVTFMQGDIHDLGSCEIAAVLAGCPRPLLVVEDGPHTYEGCMAALEFFDGSLRSGEFIVIEDGNLHDLRIWDLDNGPNRAIADFHERHPGRYRTAEEYSNFYGRNVTWNTNGYLQRI